jgi:hypothetical protein
LSTEEELGGSKATELDLINLQITLQEEMQDGKLKLYPDDDFLKFLRKSRMSNSRSKFSCVPLFVGYKQKQLFGPLETTCAKLITQLKEGSYKNCGSGASMFNHLLKKLQEEWDISDRTDTQKDKKYLNVFVVTIVGNNYLIHTDEWQEIKN